MPSQKNERSSLKLFLPAKPPSLQDSIVYREYSKLPGLTGIACQGRWPASKAYEFANKNHLSHFYIDAVSGNCNNAVIDFLAESSQAVHQTPIFHGDYRQPIASPTASIRMPARAAIINEIKIAARIHAPLIVHATSSPDLHGDAPNHEESLIAFDLELFELEHYAKELGVALWLENLPINEAAVFNCLQDYEFILQRHSSVMVVHDVGHANVRNGDPFNVLQHFPDRIAALSLSDNDGKTDLHQPLGEGQIPFEEMLELIDAANWKGIYVFETQSSPLKKDLALLSWLRD